MTIDFHAHCFPNKIAKKAIDTISYNGGGLLPYTDGTVSGLLQQMEYANVDVSVVLNIATNEHQQTAVNDFAHEINNEKNIFAFGSVYPDSTNVLDELDRIKSMGLKGVKFHPDFQGFYADDEKMKPIYKKISSLGLITTFHAGYDFNFRPPYHAMPNNITAALKWFDTPVIAAHWGGVSCSVEVLEKLCKIENLWIDTSFGYGELPKYCAQEIIQRHGVDKMLFATDIPWHNAVYERRLIESLDLNSEDKEKIYYKNAEKLLGICQSKKAKK